MLSILNLTKTNKLVLAAFAFLAVLAFGSGRAHAATLNVSGGCTLPIAINSVNAGSDQSGCTATGSYGTSDTINIPAGTITLTADLPTITESVSIEGAGLTQTIISGDNGQFSVFEAEITDGNVAISSMKLTAFSDQAILIQSTDSNVSLLNLDIDGTSAAGNGVSLTFLGTGTNDFTSDSVYVHDFISTNDTLGFSLSREETGTTNAVITNTTIANIAVTTDAGAYGFGMYAGVRGGNSGGGVLNVDLTNVTVDNLSGQTFVAPFYALAFGSNGNTTVNSNVTYATIIGTRGSVQDLGGESLESAAFYAISGGFGGGETGTSIINVKNSLFADNLMDGESKNCGLIDVTGAFSGAGSGVSQINSQGNNISDDATCTSFNQPGDQQNVSNIISTLGPLQNNGGSVPTRALLPGSPAISAGGSVLGVTTDARGIARPSTCPSVGAFQFEGAVCAASTTSPTTATAPNTGIGSTTQLLNVLACILGIALISYVFRKQQRSS